jgi:hypothetical protein
MTIQNPKNGFNSYPPKKEKNPLFLGSSSTITSFCLIHFFAPSTPARSDVGASDAQVKVVDW